MSVSPPFITTLGGMFIFRGIGRLILDNKTVAIQDSTFLNIFTKYIKIPGLDDGDTVYSALIVGVVAALFVLFSTAKTAFGRYFYAVGGNEKATKLSGINTDKIYFIAYANMGLLAGLCGLLNAARVGSVNGSTGTSFEMDAIGACFIGGASAYGGSGTVGGVVIGALLLVVINMGMSILGIGDSWQYVVKGGVLLVAVIFDVVTSRKSGK